MDKNAIARHYFEESLKIARSGHYIVDLNTVYPVNAPGYQTYTDPAALRAVMSALERNDFKTAATLLLDKSRFPRHPLGSWVTTMLRNHPEQRNPGTINLAAADLRNRGVTPDLIEAACLLPSQANRKTTGFKDWSKAGMPQAGEMIAIKKTWDATEGPWLVARSDTSLTQEARKAGVVREGGKNMDLLAKSAHGLVVWGEAKLASDAGGNQDKSIRELLALAGSKSALPVAVLDGDPWLKMSLLDKISARNERDRKSLNLLRQVSHAAQAEGCVFVSALLIPDLLRTL